MAVTIEPIKKRMGGIVRMGQARLSDDEVIEAVGAELENRGVLVFPQIAVSDAEQLAFTNRLGSRVEFLTVPGSDASSPDVLTLTLDRKINTEPDYVLGTFFWHIDGLTLDMPLPKATVLSAHHLAASGGSTEFANLYAAYEQLPEDEKQELEGLRVIHTIEAAVRPVYGHPTAERVARWRSMAPPMEHPLVWTHASGRKSLLLGTHADSIVGMPGPHGRALLWRLQQWAAQPDFVYRHKWQVGDLIIWNNQGLMHRVVPYTDEERVMHRTSVGGTERPGHIASPAATAQLFAGA